ncbi:MAG: arginine decarboxylase [Alkaliphilus sp.]|nr:aminotransferase class V-fold PLP-dependent enzyme [Alkaliphilus transvaalensis]PHS31137.1 MAG: arginine decarboxylase [Alkaliphilus sp.]
MKETLLIEKLIEISSGEKVSFHTPGHKFGKMFAKLKCDRILENLTIIDTTELTGTDNLHQPTGIIKKAQENAAEAFNSDETFFLVNGSTAGVYAMIMSAIEPGNKIIIGRDCHQSVINALILGDIQPIYIYPEVDVQNGITLGISPEKVEALIVEHKEIKAVLITYPTYYGIASDLKKITEIAHKYDKLMLVDGAHGAHLGLSEKLPITPMECGVDAVVESTHKTLPSLTQSSMLHIKGNRIDREKLRFMLRVHQSSSPSYILMASLDLATNIYKEKGNYLMDNLLYNIREFKNRIKNVEGVTLLDEKITERNSVEAIDQTKIYIKLRGILGSRFEQVLRKDYAIQMEMSNEKGVLGITSIANEKEDFSKLAIAIEKIYQNYSKEQNSEGTWKSLITNNNCYLYSTVPKCIYAPRKAYYMKKKPISLKKSVGLVCGESIIPYPPGIPLIVAGELIREDTVNRIQQIKREKTKLLGMKDTNMEYIEIIHTNEVK